MLWSDMTPERLWECDNNAGVAKELRPRSVLEVGHPKGRESVLDVWGDALVETVDPWVPSATHVCRFEDLAPLRRFDLVAMTSVLDGFEDPIAAIRHASAFSDNLLIQGKLATYTSPEYRIGYWAPTYDCVIKVLAPLLKVDPDDVWFYEDQMFFLFGRTP